LNDTVSYYSSNHATTTSYNQVFLQGGAQYKLKLNDKSNLVVGLSGNLKHNLNASQDVTRETFFRDPNTGDNTIDSVFKQDGVSGTIIYPSSFTAGFIFDRPVTKDYPGLMFGVDFSQTKWSDYRFYGMTDAVQDNWELRAGLQMTPIARQNYFSNVEYRAGFFVGEDYLNVGNKLPVYGVSFGMGLPIPNNNPLSRGQFSRVNLGFEYNKRGNNDNVLKDDIFRISVGLNFSDIWFRKPRYE
jgi:hypothetical protein